jgi:hypothetical protein
MTQPKPPLDGLREMTALFREISFGVRSYYPIALENKFIGKGVQYDSYVCVVNLNNI